LPIKKGGRVENAVSHAKKWYSHQLSAEEFKAVVEDARSGKENKKAFIGTVTPEASQRVEAVCGKKVSNIMIESEGIRHSFNKTSHNLRDGDILLIPDVVNTATDIRLSNSTHQNNDCLEFSKDIGGVITFIVEVRIHYGGWLTLVTCYRQKK
jgi:hypothetical protein